MTFSKVIRFSLLLTVFLFSSIPFSSFAQELIFEDGFETGVLDPTYWTARPSIEGASGGIVEISDVAYNGAFSVRMGRATDGGFTTNALDLSLDLSGRTEVELRFWLRDFRNEEIDGDGLYFSDDGGGSFVQVFSLESETEQNDVYMDPPPIDVDALASAFGLSLTSNFVIRFQQIGDADFNTFGDEDGWHLDDVAVTVPEIVYATLPFMDGFENGFLGPSWRVANATDPAFGAPTSPVFAPTRLSGRVGVFASTARTGTYAAQMGRDTDGEQTTNALDLLLDLSGQTNVELNFWLRDFRNEEVNGDGLYFSDDGGANFVQVFSLESGTESNDIYMNPPPIDVDALAMANGLALTSTFVIRFQQIGDADFNTFGDEDGFHIDDVSVTAPDVVYATVPFTDDFEDGVMDAAWKETDATDPAVGQPTAPVFAPARLSGRVGVVNDVARNGTYSVQMGRDADGEQTTNALDLRLNLAGKSNVKLSFWLRNFRNEELEGDGLYFSDDGGASFVQVFSLSSATEPNDIFMNPPPIDIDALAIANGLELTSTFVVRFQQIGDADFNTFGDEDGFHIDDVSVTDQEVIYAGLPFTEGFEEGSFRAMWKETDATDPAVGQPTAPSLAPSRLSGRVQVVDTGANSGTFAAQIGRDADGALTTNALDLHLDLAGQNDVELSFSLRDFANEEVDGDGLYFSDDGGATFKFVIPLETETRDNNYIEDVVDLDALATDNDLTLSSTFVVRFQQIGDADFNTFGDEDGFYLDDIAVNGNIVTSIEDEKIIEETPYTFSLGQNYPNPFNPITTIPFTLEEAGLVRLSIYDLLGREIQMLVDATLESGEHAVSFNAQGLSNGVYLYRIETGRYSKTHRMTLLK